MATNQFDQYDAPAKNPFDEFDDTPAIAATPGFVATTKRTAGQMITSTARAIDDVTGPNRVTAAAREYGQGVIDRNPAGIQSIGDIAASPLLAVKEAAGNVATQAGVGAAAAMGLEAVGQRVAGPAGAAVGRTVGGYLPMFAQEYGSIRDEQIDGGKESIPRALGAATAATALERVGPDGRIIFKGLKNPVERTVKQVAAQAGRDVLVEGATEGAQTVVEQLGAFKDPRTAEIFERNRALEQRRAALTRQYAMAAMAGDDDGRREALDEIKAWNVKNPSRAITALSLSRSIGSRQRRVAEAVDGVYLPGGKRDAMEAGRFSVTD